MSLSDEYAQVQAQVEQQQQQQQQQQQAAGDAEEQYYEEQQQFASYDESQQAQQAQAQQATDAQQYAQYEQYDQSQYHQPQQQSYQQHYEQPTHEQQQQAQAQQAQQSQHAQLQQAQSAGRPGSAASSTRGDYSQQPLRPVVPPYLHASGGPQSTGPSPWQSQGRASAAAAAPPLAAQVQAVDPRSTPEYQVAWELEVWRRSEQARLEAEWKAAGEARMRVIEEEWKKRQLADEAAHAARMAKVRALEKKLHAGLFELQNQERLLRVQEGDLASRVAGLDRELKRVEGDAEVRVARARDHAKHEVGKARAIAEEAEENLAKKKAELKSCQAKLQAAQVEAEQSRTRLSKSTVGELRLALERKGIERRRLEDDLADMAAQRDSALQRLQLALDKACELKGALERKEHEALALERKDMERLRMAYLAKQESQGLRRDLGELMEIKRQVREHLQHSAGPARTPVTQLPEHRPHAFSAGAAPTVPDWSAASPHFAPPPPAAAAVPFSAAPFNPIPQTGGAARPPLHASSAGVQANAVPQPYHYFVHEKEVLQRALSESEGRPSSAASRGRSASRGR